MKIDFPEIYQYLVERNKDIPEPNDSFNLDDSIDLFEVNLTEQQPQLQLRNEFLIDMDDDDMDDLLKQAGDYRNNPCQQPTLSDEQKEKVYIYFFSIFNINFGLPGC